MKKITRTILSFCALSLVMVSCQKEVGTEIPGLAVVDAGSSVYYIVDGQNRQIRVDDDAALSALLSELLSGVRNGSVVTIGKGAYTYNHAWAKEKVTYTTPNQEDAIVWVKTMLDEGYEVLMYYDDEQGLYVCIATK